MATSVAQDHEELQAFQTLKILVVGMDVAISISSWDPEHPGSDMVGSVHRALNTNENT